MAATTRLSRDVDFYLNLIRRNVEALPRVEQRRNDAESLAAFTEDELLADEVSFRDEWRDLMDRLGRRLDAPYRAGRMSPSQAEAYRSLLALTRDMLPVMARLRLAPPLAIQDGSSDERAPARSGSPLPPRA